ncbi:hypothetical protein [Bacillus sp. JJ722]|uniref:hypothetical protein n=1 Tax=Bacillus sp. JJ722 TaxID=3122973 RepID=UPI002FFF636C
MAKLNGVKTIDMVNGEITKVSYDGAEYAKVGGKAQKNDIAQVVKAWGSQKVGAFYRVNQEEHPLFHKDSTLIFIAGEVCDASSSAKSMVLFRKVSTPANPSLESRVDELEAKVEAIAEKVSTPVTGELKSTPYDRVRRPKEGDKVKVVRAYGTRGKYANGDTLTIKSVDPDHDVRFFVEENDRPIRDIEVELIVEPTETITHKGAKYTLVSRKAQAGDVVVFTESNRPYVTNGKTYGPVGENLYFEDNDYDNILVYREDVGRTEQSVKVYAPVSEAKPAYRRIAIDAGKVGDFVIFAKSKGDYIIADKYYKIMEFDSYGDPQIIDEDGDGYDTNDDSFEVYTLCEEEANPAPEPLKVGDYAKVVGDNYSREYNSHRMKIGTIVKVKKVSDLRQKYEAEDVLTSKNRGFVESDLVRATDVEVAQAKAEAHKASFEVGDYALVIYENHEHRVGHIVKINKIKPNAASSVFDFGVDRITIGGSGYIAAKNIEKISAEEAELEAKWAKIGRKPNEFKKGDIVRVNASYGGHEVGTVGELVSGEHFPIKREFGVKANGIVRDHTSDVELITPVEARFDK